MAGLDALLTAGRRLLEVDPERFGRVLALCRTYVSIHDLPDEEDAVFESRMMELGTVEARAKENYS